MSLENANTNAVEIRRFTAYDELISLQNKIKPLEVYFVTIMVYTYS